MMPRSRSKLSSLWFVLVLFSDGHQKGNQANAYLQACSGRLVLFGPRGCAIAPCERRAYTTRMAYHHSDSSTSDEDCSTGRIRAETSMSGSRRELLRTAAHVAAVTTTLVGLEALVPSTTSLSSRRSTAVANAYDKTFPDQLNAADGVMDERQRRINEILDGQQNQLQPGQMSAPGSDPSLRRPGSYGGGAGLSSFSVTPLGSAVWAGALWLLSGSRSNPLATPLANLLYNETDEEWLQDRNEGLFANLPLPLLLLLGVGFVLAGVLVDGTVSALAGPDKDSSLQLAGVTLIGGATLELGRVASGEKRLTRIESDRELQLESEFQAFADSRLQRGGTCHRLDVVRAFRRYYAKYRQPDNPDYPLSDLEIEQLLRSWSRQFAGVEMSSAGFYTGIKINQDADVFTSQL